MFLRIKDTTCKNFQYGFSYLESKIIQPKNHPVLKLIMFSIILNFVLEMLSRRSIVKGLGFVLDNPLMFLLNTMIILLTLSITMMFPRRNFLLTMVSIVWLGLGITNLILLGFRTTPLTAVDFYLLKSTFGIVHIYLDTFQLILICISILIVLVTMLLFWIKCPQKKAQIRMPLTILGVTTILIFIVSTTSYKVNAVSKNYANLADAYTEYGFAYCFSKSVFDRGIDKPDGYSEESIGTILKTIQGEPNKNNTMDKNLNRPEPPSGLEGGNISGFRPNVIMVQLESFFDVNHLIDYTFSENPVPNFTQLKRTYSSGYLTVPTIGAGTANTEFEVISGMGIEYFGAGEYPYKTILQSTTSESVCYNLEQLGYHSHAIHNNTATFYDRITVFSKLGFDSYSSIEYMNNVEYNPLGWAKDNVLTTEILKALQARGTRDFIYTISVQPHGKYPDTVIDANQKIKVTVDPEKRQPDDDDGSYSETSEIKLDEGYINKLEYFANQLSETDQFIGELVGELSMYDEPTVVIFFGDHLPSLFFENEDLKNNDRFQTEYILWSNFNMGKVNRDLKAYQLYAYVMERLGYDQGVLTKFHQRYANEPDYQEKLEMLQYDMLYGERYAFGGENPYREKALQMGVFEVAITNVTQKGEVILIEGENFTPWSVVYMDDEAKETFYMDENTLMVPYEESIGERIYVAQVSDGSSVISQSEEWVPNLAD